MLSRTLELLERYPVSVVPGGALESADTGVNGLGSRLLVLKQKAAKALRLCSAFYARSDRVASRHSGLVCEGSRWRYHSPVYTNRSVQQHSTNKGSALHPGTTVLVRKTPPHSTCRVGGRRTAASGHCTSYPNSASWALTEERTVRPTLGNQTRVRRSARWTVCVNRYWHVIFAGRSSTAQNCRVQLRSVESAMSSRRVISLHQRFPGFALAVGGAALQARLVTPVSKA